MPKGRKQPHLPKTQTEVEKRIDELAALIVEQDVKIAEAEDAKAPHWQSLEQLMRENGRESYRYVDGDVDKMFTFKTIGQLKVRNTKKSEKKGEA